MRPAGVFVQMIVEACASPGHQDLVEAELAELRQEIDRFRACWSSPADAPHRPPAKGC
jgi:hypothetical protein